MARIAVTADLHFDSRGYLTEPAVVEKLVLRIQAAAPEAVIIAGDLGHPSADFAGCLDAFRGLSCPVAVLAGNHDVWRDEQGWSSRELWERRLPSLVSERGFLWLESSVLRIGAVAVVGSLAWYDYSAAPAALQLPTPYYAAMKKSLNNDGAWIDWLWSDVELAEVLRRGLLRRLESLEAEATVKEVVVVTHVPLFEAQLVRKPADRRWEISNAYFGNLTTGHAVQQFKKVTRVISGHTHMARQGVVSRAAGPDLLLSVVGSDYGTPEVELLELDQV